MFCVYLRTEPHGSFPDWREWYRGRDMGEALGEFFYLKGGQGPQFIVSIRIEWEVEEV